MWPYTIIIGLGALLGRSRRLIMGLPGRLEPR